MTDYGDNPVRPSIRRGWPLMSMIPAGVFSLVLIFGALFWFVIRVEVDADKILVLVNKTGKTLPAELLGEFGDQVVLYPELVRAVAEHTGET